MKPYLIQRAEFASRPEKKGIDRIIRLDYMGSSEFEWGALPESLARIRTNIDQYTYFQHTFKPNKVVTVFCKKDQAEELPGILEQLVDPERPLQLKERCDLIDCAKPEKCFSPYNRNSFWWDIENDYMFWKANPEFEEQFKQLINQRHW